MLAAAGLDSSSSDDFWQRVAEQDRDRNDFALTHQAAAQQVPAELDMNDEAQIPTVGTASAGD